jgi:hypothetical protein
VQDTAATPAYHPTTTDDEAATTTATPDAKNIL